MEKRTKIQNHFDNPNPNLHPQKDLPGEIEMIAARDQREAGARQQAEERKHVFNYIREHPGCTITAIAQNVGRAGLKEWLRDGFVIKRGSGHYVAK